jgi:hypothetical protein
MDINHADKASFTAQSEVAYLQYVENEYCGKHRCMQVMKPECFPRNHSFLCAMSPGFSGSSVNLYDLCDNEEGYLTSFIVAEMTPGHSHYAPCLLTAARFCFDSPLELTNNWRQLIQISMITTLTK